MQLAGLYSLSKPAWLYRRDACDILSTVNGCMPTTSKGGSVHLPDFLQGKADHDQNQTDKGRRENVLAQQKVDEDQ